VDSEPAGLAATDVTIPLELTFAKESWAEVTDARGERLFYGLGAPNQHAVLRGEPPFAVVLGNAGAVKLLVDGETYPIPIPGREGSIARFAVDIAEE
jgi:cytoskeleton protein RodZ